MRRIRRGYTGHEHDPETGLVNMVARLYDPVTARFLTPDPVLQVPGWTQSHNRFSYAWNSPFNWVDPSGTQNECGYGYDEQQAMCAPLPSEPNMSSAPGPEVLESRLPPSAPPDVRTQRTAPNADSTEEFGPNVGLAGPGASPSVEPTIPPPSAPVEILPIFSPALRAMRFSHPWLVFLAIMFTDSNVGKPSQEAMDDQATQQRADEIAEAEAKVEPSTEGGGAMVPGGGGRIRIGPGWRARSMTDPACRNGCESVARQIRNLVGGEIKRIVPVGAPGLGAYRGANLGWAHHDVVVSGGRVYDAFTGSQGVSIPEFKGLWEHPDAINFGF